MGSQQGKQELDELRSSIDYWKKSLENKLSEKLTGPTYLYHSIILHQVIIFTLRKLDVLLKEHQELALATIKNSATIENDCGAYKHLITLIRFSHQTFENIEQLQKTYTNDAGKYDKISMRAVEAILTILAILLLSAFAIYIASTLTTVATMPIVYSLVAGAGAMILLMVIGVCSESYAFYLKNNKIPKEMKTSTSEFYNDQLFVDTSRFEQNNKDVLHKLHKKFYLTGGSILIDQQIEPNAFTSRDFDKIDDEIRGLEYSIRILPEPESEGTISYFPISKPIDSEETTPTIHKVIYRVKGDKIKSFCTKKHLTKETIINGVLENITGIHTKDFRQRFFNNANTEILGNPNSSDEPSQQDVNTFLETVPSIR